MLPLDKLQAVVRRRSEIDDLMCDPKVIADSAKIQALGRERSQILPLVEAVGEWEGTEKKLREATEMSFLVDRVWNVLPHAQVIETVLYSG